MNTSLKENLGHRGGTAVRAPDPSPIQIRLICKKLQQRWTEEERYQRGRYYQVK